MNVPNLRSFYRKLFTKEEITSLVFLEIILGILFSFASLLVYLYIANSVAYNQTVALDNYISNFVFSFRNPLLTQVMKFFSFIGGNVLIFCSIIFVVLLTLKKYKRESAIFLVLFIMGLTATTMLKLMYRVPRPEVSALVWEGSYSFPSGHAVNSLLFYGALSYFFFHFTKRKKGVFYAAIVVVILVSLIGLSRIYLGVHHPSDVIAGYIVGFWLLATTLLVDKTIAYFRLLREI